MGNRCIKAKDFEDDISDIDDKTNNETNNNQQFINIEKEKKEKEKEEIDSEGEEKIINDNEEQKREKIIPSNINYKISLNKQIDKFSFFSFGIFPCGNFIISQRIKDYNYNANITTTYIHKITIFNEELKKIQIILNKQVNYDYNNNFKYTNFVVVKDNNNFAIGNIKGEIEIFYKGDNEEQFKLNQTIKAHNNRIENLVYYKNGKILISNDFNREEIKIFSLNFNQKYELLTKIVTNVLSFIYIGDYNILISSNEIDTKIFNLKTFKCSKIMKNVDVVSPKNSIFRIDNDRIVFCGKIMRIMCLKEKKIIKRIYGYYTRMGCNIKNKGIFVCTSFLGIYLFRSDKYVCIQKLDNYNRNILEGILYFKNDQFITYPNIKFWSIEKVNN